MEYNKLSRVIHLAQGVQKRITQQNTMLSVVAIKTQQNNNKNKTTP